MTDTQDEFVPLFVRRVPDAPSMTEEEAHRLNDLINGRDPLVTTMTRIVHALGGKHGENQRRIANEGVQWLDLLLRKNADYGSTVWDVPKLAPECSPDTAIRVRMSDKIDRLISLLQKRNPEVAESLEDTIRDLGAYCLLYLCRPQEPAPCHEVPPDATIKRLSPHEMQGSLPTRPEHHGYMEKERIEELLKQQLQVDLNGNPASST